MKILMVSGTFPPRRFGGVTAVSYALAKRLVERGNEVTVFTTDVGNSLQSRLDIEGTKIVDGISVHYFRNISNLLAFQHRLFLPVGMVSALRKNINDFDIIHIHDFRGFQGIITSYFARKNGVAHIFEAHGSLPTVMTKRKLKRIYDILFGYRYLKAASKVIALSSVEVEQYKAMGVLEERIAVIPNGIDLSEFVNLPPEGCFKERFGIPKGKKIILYLGRIHKIKGINFLVKAYAHLTENMNFDNAILVIAGPDDGYLDEIQALINSLEMGDRVLLTGPLYGQGKLEAYVDADVYVLPSRYEIWGLTIFEAAACSTPVIVTSGNAINETICEGGFGFSVKYGDIIELAEIMHKVLNSDSLLEEMGREGRKFVFENCDWTNIVTKLEKLYEEVVDN